MADIKARFHLQVEKVRKLASSPSSEELLELYALYKQTTEGDNSNPAPWAIQVREKRKWVAWEALNGMPVPMAATRYADLVENLIIRYGVHDIPDA